MVATSATVVAAAVAADVAAAPAVTVTVTGAIRESEVEPAQGREDIKEAQRAERRWKQIFPLSIGQTTVQS